MTDCENYTHEDIQAACEDMQWMDDEQKLQRIYELLQDLDAEYDAVSAALWEEFKVMALELNKLYYWSWLSNLTGKSEDIVRQSKVIAYMINDFNNDGDMEDIFFKYGEFQHQRNEYIKEMTENLYTVKVFPNPTSWVFTFSVCPNYDFAKAFDPIYSDIFTIPWIWVFDELLPFDPLMGLPKKLSSTDFDASWILWWLQRWASPWLTVSNVNGSVVQTSGCNIDDVWNIEKEVDISHAPNGVYFVHLTYNLINFSDSWLPNDLVKKIAAWNTIKIVKQ